MHLYKTPYLAKSIFRSLLWNIDTSKKEIYLTFDDGPVPGVTEWVLQELEKYNAKATFFVVGENITKHPVIFKMLLGKGHTIGNHTFNHLNAWNNNLVEYIDNVRRCQSVIEEYTKSLYFRPPHGKVTPSMIRSIKKTNKIVMWDVLSGDYNPSISAETCLKKSLEHSKEGTIIVFHDSYKAEAKLKNVLPKYLEVMSKRGFQFKAL